MVLTDVEGFFETAEVVVNLAEVRVGLLGLVAIMVRPPSEMPWVGLLTKSGNEEV